MQRELTIKIYENSEGEFNYDIFDTTEVDDDTEPIDGGTCTGETIQEALSMATEHTQSLIIRDLINGEK